MHHSPRLLHARVPRLLVVIGSLAALLIPVVVFAAGGSTYSLMVSGSPSRTSAVALDGNQVSGNVYIFMSPTSGVTKTSFWLDNPAMTGTPTHIEGSAPIDFVGTDPAGKGKPWNASAAAGGTHTITAKVETKSGTTSFTTTFTVQSGVGIVPPPAAVASSTPRPTATPTAKATIQATPTPAATPTPKPAATPTPKPAVTPTPKPTAPPTRTPAPAPTAIPAGFLGTSGTQFTLGGQPFTFTGFNIYQANSRANCSSTMGTGSALDTALSSIGAGSEVFRAWFFQSLATTNGQRDWSAFDHTLAVARAHGVKIVVTLGNQWGSCEGSQYLDDSWYLGGYKTQVISGDTVPYRQFVQEIVSRYKDDPTIAMWQLINEAEIKTGKSASSCSPTADLYNFAADVSGLIKSIDPNHLVNLGQMGAGQCGAQGGDYKLVNSISTLDVCEYHDYGHETTALPTNLVNDIAACNSLGKPLFVGEAGIQESTVGSLSARAAAFDAKCTAMFKAGVRGFLIWSWNNSPSSGSWEVGPGDPTLPVIDSY
jgi:mannan endo-1,4-beta-mannosidase